MSTVISSSSAAIARFTTLLGVSFITVCNRVSASLYALVISMGRAEFRWETDAYFADRIPSFRAMWPGKSVLGPSTPATTPPTPRVDSPEVKSISLRPDGVPDHLLQKGGLSTPVMVPVFTEAAVRPDRSKAESNATRSRNHREGSNSEHSSKVNIPSNEVKLQQCKQLLPTGGACPNLYQRTKKKKMCKACHLRSKPLTLSDISSASSSASTSSDQDSRSEESAKEADIRLMRIYTRGTTGPPETHKSTHVPLLTLALSPLIFLLEVKQRGVALMGLICVATLFLDNGVVLLDGGSRRDPRLNETYSNILDGDLLPYTKDEMLYLGHGGYITRPVDWDIVLWLRAHKRVKITKNNARAVLAYVLSQYPETPLSLARDTSAYFMQELQQDEIYFDHHTVLTEQGTPPSYPDGHWRPN